MAEQDEDPIIDTLTRELGFRVTGHQVVWYRFAPTDDSDKYRWKPMAAKPATVGETALWDQLVIARRALLDVSAERDKLRSGRAVSPEARPGPTHGEAAEPRRG